MNTLINILIVEDEAVLAMSLGDKLETEGYRVVGIANNGLKAIDLFHHNTIDLLLCDIHIKGDLDGIETVQQIMAIRRVPIIYLTAFSDDDTVNRAQKTFPAAYLVKPYNTATLRIAIEVAIRNYISGNQSKIKVNTASPSDKSLILRLNDVIFLKQSYQFLKLAIADILLLEAEDNYTTFVTITKKYALRLSLSVVLEKLYYPQLIRVHRSYAVNLNHVDTFNEQEICVGLHIIPLSKNYREDFLHRLTV